MKTQSRSFPSYGDLPEDSFLSWVAFLEIVRYSTNTSFCCTGNRFCQFDNIGLLCCIVREHVFWKRHFLDLSELCSIQTVRTQTINNNKRKIFPYVLRKLSQNPMKVCQHLLKISIVLPIHSSLPKISYGCHCLNELFLNEILYMQVTSTISFIPLFISSSPTLTSGPALGRSEGAPTLNLHVVSVYWRARRNIT